MPGSQTREHVPLTIRHIMAMCCQAPRMPSCFGGYGQKFARCDISREAYFEVAARIVMIEKYITGGVI